MTPLRFAITSPPSGCEGDLHPKAVNHARRTRERPRTHPGPCSRLHSMPSMFVARTPKACDRPIVRNLPPQTLAEFQCQSPLALGSGSA
jgi:hypothetical protein